MKSLLRYLLINIVSLWLTTLILPGLHHTGGLKTLFIGGLIFSVINILLVPLLKILLLPLNLLTLGLFAWVTNVLALYALTTIFSGFTLTPYNFSGINLGGLIIPSLSLSTFWVAVLASLIIGLITHFLHWLSH